jgi:phosphohistidine phosphatase
VRRHLQRAGEVADGQRGVRAYLIRHGVAAERGDAHPDDTKRPLTSDGIQKLRKEAKALLVLDVTFDVILTSPLVRTRQTAETIAAAFRNPPPIINLRALAPGGAHNAIIDELSKQHRRHRTLVGHEPGIGELAARLIGLRRSLEFKKGGIAGLMWPPCRRPVPVSCAGSSRRVFSARSAGSAGLQPCL